MVTYSVLGAVDVANNRRDNLTSFHDVMASYRWEVRCLAFFLAVAEANAFPAYKCFAHDGSEIMHSKFRWSLWQSLLQYARNLEESIPIPSLELQLGPRELVSSICVSLWVSVREGIV